MCCRHSQRSTKFTKPIPYLQENAIVTHPSLTRGPVVVWFGRSSSSNSSCALMFSRAARMGLTLSSKVDFGISDKHLRRRIGLGCKSDNRSERWMAREMLATNRSTSSLAILILGGAQYTTAGWSPQLQIQ